VPFAVVSVDGRTVRLAVRIGGEPCDGVRRVAVSETAATVTVKVTAGPKPGAACHGVPALVGTFPVRVQLARPLGARRLVDGAR